MIFLRRRRLIIWLLKAYFKKWKTTFLLFFTVGLGIFFLLYFFVRFFHYSPSFNTKEAIGVVGSYNIDNLPNSVLNKLSFGLTEVSSDGKPIPMAASSWEIKDNGKTYSFKLKDNLFFNDKTKLTSDLINYNFKDVSVTRPSKDTIEFKLKDSYSPFLVTVTKPIFKKEFVGLRDYRLGVIDLNGEFINSMELHKRDKEIVYQFYPTEEALKTALVLNEINKTDQISDLSFTGLNLKDFKNYKIEKNTNYDKLVTLFYNTQDKVVSEKRLREAIAYALPDEFSYGKRTRTPYPPQFWASQEETYGFNQDISHAKSLLSLSQASSSARLKLTISTLPRYQKTAEDIAKSLKLIGLNSKIETVNSIPSNFQIFLGEFNVSKDPDQYALWHSEGSNNITGYKNLRIDKLLEDGRKITDFSERQKIYSDFQKYLLDDPPASFLYFPYNYSFTK